MTRFGRGFHGVAVLALTVSLTACSDGRSRERPVPDLPPVHANLTFTCTHEAPHIPPRDPEAEQLYRHARWLERGNLLKPKLEVWERIERLIRIATAHGHDKANLELRNMIGRGEAWSADVVKETLDLAEDLIARGIPGGYYDMGRYLEKGYGVKQDSVLARKYFRKAADLGNPEAQYAIGELLAPIENAPEVARQMRRCAAEQGHAKAGLALGVDFQTDGLYAESLQAFQLATQAGNPTAATFLQDGFNGPPPDDHLDYIGQDKDEERVRRYDALRLFLGRYSYLNPKVPEIDRIVPLPPAKLPPWDGKLEWLTDFEANIPPPLPSEERIAEMALAKGLDPATGRPLPAKRAEAPAPWVDPSFANPRVPLGTRLASGTLCPQSGIWACDAALASGVDRHFFHAGERLPRLRVDIARSWLQKLRNAPEVQLTHTTWTLVELSTGKDKG